jgi:hypothetical protein
MHNILFVGCLLFGSILTFNAQIIDNSEGQAFGQIPFFNSTFVAKNKLKKLKGFYSVTSPTTPVIQTGLYCVYEFDEQGLLTHTIETYQGIDRIDSLENFYFYNSKNQLIQQRKKEFNGFTAIVNELDEKGRIIKQVYKRDVLNRKNELVESFIISEETMKYQQSDSSEICTIYNNYNLPYSEISKKYNSHGYLIEVSERSITTSGLYKTSYSYNERGWLESKKKFVNSSSEPVEEWRYQYDSFGNIKNIFFYSFGVLEEEKEIYYNDKTLILSNILFIDAKTKRVKMLQLKEKQFYK